MSSLGTRALGGIVIDRVRISNSEGQSVSGRFLIEAAVRRCSAALHLAIAKHRTFVLEAQEIGFDGSVRRDGVIKVDLRLMHGEMGGTLGRAFGERRHKKPLEPPQFEYSLIEQR